MAINLYTDQNSYAGFVDGEHWVTLITSFEEWAEKRHYQPHAIATARRMAETADDVSNDLVMAMFEIVEAEIDDELNRLERENNYDSFDPVTPVWQMFNAMCEQFTSGYQPKQATEFVKELVARLAGLR